MGFIGRGCVEMSITSRFDNGDNNYFLYYMLQKVFAINLFDLQTSMDSMSMWDFLIFLFPYYLKRTLRQGLYKKYQRREHNDSQVKGAIDVARHIKRNIPFAGRIAYTTREYSYDNDLTQLIRHTIEFLGNHHKAGKNILRADSETVGLVQQIISATPTYNRHHRTQIMGANIKFERHPYFTEYVPLQRLCMQILRRERLNYSQREDEKVYGLLFDGAWLWEEYLNTILVDLGFNHPQNKEGKGAIKLFTNGLAIRYPDFYKDDIVLDAKYKWLGEYASRDDINQIITYMHCLPARCGGLIYPKSIPECSSAEHYGTLKGFGGEFYRLHLGISSAQDYDSFAKEMQSAEDMLKDKVRSLYIEY